MCNIRNMKTNNYLFKVDMITLTSLHQICCHDLFSISLNMVNLKTITVTHFPPSSWVSLPAVPCDSGRSMTEDPPAFRPCSDGNSGWSCLPSSLGGFFIPAWLLLKGLSYYLLEISSRVPPWRLCLDPLLPSSSPSWVSKMFWLEYLTLGQVVLLKIFSKLEAIF